MSISQDEYRELEQQAKLILSFSCQELLVLMQNKVLSLSKSDINPLELKGMMRLIGYLLEIPSDFENEKSKLENK